MMIRKTKEKSVAKATAGLRFEWKSRTTRTYIVGYRAGNINTIVC